MGAEVDTLIIETLGYLKSVDALPVLKRHLIVIDKGIIKLIIAAAIFEIGRENEMIDIAVNSIERIVNQDVHNKYVLPSAFYYLAKFNDEKTKQILQDYSSHPDYIISYNAKRYLGMIDAAGYDK